MNHACCSSSSEELPSHATKHCQLWPSRALYKAISIARSTHLFNAYLVADPTCSPFSPMLGRESIVPKWSLEGGAATSLPK